MAENKSDQDLSTSSHAGPAKPAVTRVRHDAKMRMLEVHRVERIANWLVRITLGGPDLAGFVSLGFDDHVKLFIPPAGVKQPVLPTLGANGMVFPDGAERPSIRDFTPRKFDSVAGELTIDFALHDAGPATAWASEARPGDFLGVGGPRGSMIMPVDFFKCHILIGDETAIPAISRRLEELPSGVRARVIALVPEPGSEIELISNADLDVTWAYRRTIGQASTLLDLARRSELNATSAYAWVACESSDAKILRAHLVDERGFDPNYVKASGYWRRGSVAVHDTHSD